MIDRLKNEMKEGESLLICCKSFAKGCEFRYSNISIKKIPLMLLGRCEFGKDDYSFNIVNLPINDEIIEDEINQEEDIILTQIPSNISNQTKLF